MSSVETRVSLATAREAADALVALLAPFCERLEVAGSIRRQRADVGDIDLVAIPLLERTPAGLFGDAEDVRDLLAERCDALFRAGTLAKRLDKNGRPTWGPHLKRMLFRGMPVDLQVVEAATFGAWMAIRTGPERWTRGLVTPRRQGGMLPPGRTFDGGFRLLVWDKPTPTPEEMDLFAALELSYVAPEDRR